MKPEVTILQSGNIYFFYRPKVANEEETQRFFFVLRPINQGQYKLLIVGRKHLPPKNEGSYFLMVEGNKKGEKELLQSLTEKHYHTKTRGERVLPTARCLGEGKYLLVVHNNHTHFIYQLTNPTQIKKEQEDFNLQLTDDYLISIKNPQMPASLHREINFPSHLQEKFANRHFISLTNSEFLDYAGVELLLIPKNNGKY